MTTERSANINIGGDEYTLLLTTKATKDIAVVTAVWRTWAIS